MAFRSFSFIEKDIKKFRDSGPLTNKIVIITPVRQRHRLLGFRRCRLLAAHMRRAAMSAIRSLSGEKLIHCAQLEFCR